MGGYDKDNGDGYGDDNDDDDGDGDGDGDGVGDGVGDGDGDGDGDGVANHTSDKRLVNTMMPPTMNVMTSNCPKAVLGL